jgi:hypothetical protein
MDGNGSSNIKSIFFAMTLEEKKKFLINLKAMFIL